MGFLFQQQSGRLESSRRVECRGKTPLSTDIKQKRAERTASYRTRQKVLDVLARMKRKSAARGWAEVMTKDQVTALVEDVQHCNYCGLRFDVLKVLGVEASFDRMDNSAGYTKANTALCCFNCNAAKGHVFTANDMHAYIGPAIARAYERRFAELVN